MGKIGKSPNETLGAPLRKMLINIILSMIIQRGQPVVKRLDAVKIYLNLSTALMVFLSVYWWALAIIIMSMLGSCLPGLQVVHGYVSFD
jgi:hypothetical protein